VKARVVVCRWQGGESLVVREVANETQSTRRTVHAEKMHPLSVPHFWSGIGAPAGASAEEMEGDPLCTQRGEIFPVSQNDDGDRRRL